MKKIITYNFNEAFLDNLMGYIDEHYLRTGKSLDRVAIVFGGRRPALFLKRQIAHRLGKGFVSPKFFTIDEFVRYIISKKTSFKNTGDLDNCFWMYQLVKKEAPYLLKKRASFAQFLPWTREIIRFIDQLDLEHIDNKGLEGIKANAAIGYDVPQDINKLLQSIVHLREGYHKQLEKVQGYSRGYQYLKAAQLVGDLDFNEFDQILFCNFFYLNKSEEKIVKVLHDADKAVLFFQGNQEKWPVLKRVGRLLNCAIDEEDKREGLFDLKVYAGFDTHSQIAHLREILKGIDQLEQTVIVLPNADNIIPLISEIAPLVKDFNISMGYPLKRSSLFTLFSLFYKAQLSAKGGRYYAKDYLKALQHPFIKNLQLGAESSVTRILVHKIEEVLTGKEHSDLSGQLFVDLNEVEECDAIFEIAREMLVRLKVEITKNEIKDVLKKLHRVVFASWENISNFDEFSDSFSEVLTLLVEKSLLKNFPLNLNIANKMFDIAEELKNAAFALEPFPKEDLFRVFENKVNSEIVAFIGSPLKGLQILGLFETRSLNFKNVIVLDANEGVLPSLNVYEPLIPREVMISLKLDRLELEEEIQRYQFMRLISSAKNVHVIYQQSKDKERSRFVEELIWEQEKSLDALGSTKIYEAAFQTKSANNDIVIEKTKEVSAFLKTLTYSASSINTYLRDPLEFYYSYVLGLREKEDLLDEPEARQVGTFIHEFLEECFKPFLNKQPIFDQKFNLRSKRIFEQKFKDSFGKSSRSDAFLLKAVIEERMARFFDHEREGEGRQVKRILHLESRFDDVIDLECGKMKFRYVVDRVDELADGTIMIVDYKTGSVNQMPADLKAVKSIEFSREAVLESVGSFQIPLYFHYLNKQFKDVPVNAALYNLRTLKLDTFLNKKNNYPREDIDNVFMNVLNSVITEILDVNVPFIANR